MKRLILLVMIGGLTAAPIQDDFRQKLVKFHISYDVFIRKYIGCPPTPVVKQDGYQAVECNPIMGIVDQAAFAKARAAAKDLFDLEEKR